MMTERGNKKSQSSRSQHGAALLEFALSALCFIVFFFAIFEVSRVLAVRALLIKGAQDAAILASQLPDIDLEYPTSAGGTPNYNSPLFLRYFKARQRVIDEAVRTPLNTLVGTAASCPLLPQYFCEERPIGERLQMLQTFDLPRPSAYGEGALQMDAILLRPDKTDLNIGYQVRDEQGNLLSTRVRYPADFNLTLNDGSTFQRTLRDFPLVVEVRAEVEPILRILGPIQLVARATSFREPPPESSLSQVYTGAPPPTVTTTTVSTSTTRTTTTTTSLTTTSSTTTTTRPPGTSTTTSSTTTTTRNPGTSTTSTSTTTTARPTSTTSTTTTTTRSTTSTTTSTTTTTTLYSCPPNTPSYLRSDDECWIRCGGLTATLTPCVSCSCGG